VMRVPGWRAMSPDSLGRIIESRLIAERQGAVIVLARSRMHSADLSALAFTLPTVALHMFGTMSVPEMCSWIAWTWILWVLIRFTPRRQWPRPAA